MKSKNSRIGNLYTQLDRLGIGINDIDALIKIERTLNAWHTEECNGTIVRLNTAGGEDYEGKPNRKWFIRGEVAARYTPISDRGAGALKRLNKIMSAYPNLAFRTQGDPRGCALYIMQLNGPDVAVSF